ncbi:P-loop containing nucleoside triphosphate hydrolase protein [Zychaea mexicana]|uniref:P-loop containing nucleoside triphosphate hydrolase protein n=1 Tax=Zychaea mexicana TaxID=64656 RepID=UPI0022FE2B57|nr:P-loop containing nucleoside triphosphate hydrolase protein [Zychaea mexicana]KAI9494353.1 P-loop containing nucleoside triphosphate hydrolase protein [Zychaea mexicana]
MAPLKIIGAGYGRTGTDSLRVALDMLGYKTHHRKTFNDEGGRADMFIEAYEHPEEEADFDYMYEDFDAALDWPTCVLLEPLMLKYPDAKVILTVRDPNSWYRSMANTIFRKRERPKHLLDRPKSRVSRRVVLDGARDIPGMFEDEEAIKQKFIQHNEWVKTFVAPERLLVMELGEGWTRLCRFLDKPKPVVAYPHVNTTADVHAKMAKVDKELYQPLACTAVLSSAIAE